MNLQPTLENELVKIRPLDISDLESLYEVVKDPQIWEQHPCKRYLRPEYEKYFYESIQSKGALIILDNATDNIIGSSRYKLVDGFSNGVEIGWTFLAREYWGGKYNKAIKELMIEHAMHFVDNIVFYVHKNNVRSQRAVEKIGGQKIGESDYQKIPERNVDTFIFILKKAGRK